MIHVVKNEFSYDVIHSRFWLIWKILKQKYVAVKEKQKFIDRRGWKLWTKHQR